MVLLSFYFLLNFMRKICWAFFICLCSFSVSAKEIVYLYTYHKKPPFIVDLSAQTGLYFDLAKSLTNNSKKFEFRTLYVPRKRLNLLLEGNKLDGAVMGVSPVWFKDKTESKYLWTSGFYQDKDEFVSLKTAPFEYSNVSSLHGKIVGSVAGFYYKEVNEGVKAGKFLRVDTVGELEVLKLIEKKRVDVGLVSESVFKYLKKAGQVQDIFHTSSTPHDQFIRRAFTTKDQVELYQELSNLLNQIQATNELNQLLTRYE